jgi:hypothetical protein
VIRWFSKKTGKSNKLTFFTEGTEHWQLCLVTAMACYFVSGAQLIGIKHDDERDR